MWNPFCWVLQRNVRWTEFQKYENSLQMFQDVRETGWLKCAKSLWKINSAWHRCKVNYWWKGKSWRSDAFDPTKILIICVHFSLSLQTQHHPPLHQLAHHKPVHIQIPIPKLFQFCWTNAYHQNQLVCNHFSRFFGRFINFKPMVGWHQSKCKNWKQTSANLSRNSRTSPVNIVALSASSICWSTSSGSQLHWSMKLLCQGFGISVSLILLAHFECWLCAPKKSTWRMC